VADRTVAITGRTRVFAVIGDPITQVQAPTLVNALFERLGHDAVLVPVHIRAVDLAEAMAGLRLVANLDGVLVTVPHKAAAVSFADQVTAAVSVTGATNALRREPDGTWTADNFDGIGFVSGLRHAGHDPAGRSVALVGAGGAGSAIAAALLDAGVAALSVCDPDAARLSDLLARLSARWPGRVAGSDRPELGGVQLVVNATPLGLRPDDPLPFDPAQAPPDAVVADIIMQPRETALLRCAAGRGMAVHAGQHMLLHQLDAYREFFRLPESAS
jgi:shikimate dehydrogenase